jgi:long-chain acyl-CoA synthetase
MLPTGPHEPVVSLAGASRTVGDMFRRRAELSARRAAIYEKRDGRWEALSWAALYERARHVAGGLARLGLEEGERVAILGPTRSPWAVYDMAAQLAGLVSLGIYPRQSVEQIRYILGHSDTRVVFVDEPEELEAVIAAADELEALDAIVPWDEALARAHAGRDPRIRPPSALAGAPLDEARIATTIARTDPEDMAILVYTSGTTGPPKGAMITHLNILSVLARQQEFLQLYEDDLSLNFLPMAHAAERVLGFYGRIASGLTNAYASSFADVLVEVKEVQPTLFGSVPRIFEKAYAAIHAQAEKKPPAVQRILARAEEVARRAAACRVAERPLPPALAAEHALFDALVYRKIREAFGGRARHFVTGAAPIAVEILEFFWGAGLPVYEVYGMTEATVVTHVNRPGMVKLGTVGRVIDPMEHRIAHDGEVLLRGPFVFKGYFKDDQATAETIVDGWLRTGDVGAVDDDGYLSITDRKKHLIITSGGKNLSPANIENAIKRQDPLISQVHAHGDRRAYVAALVAPSPLETLAWGAERGLVSQGELEARTRELVASPSARSEALGRALATVVEHADYRGRMREAVRRGNAELAQVERVRRFVILDRDFSQEQGELTPTMKLKRKSVETKYAALFDRVYAEDGFALEA